MTETESYIYRPKSSIYFSIFADCLICNAPKNWKPSVCDYAEVSPDSLYLVFPNGTFLSYKTETAVQCGVLRLPDCRTDFTEDSPCVKGLLRNGKYRVLIHAQPCYVYTPAKFKKLLQQAGRKSLAKQLAYIKSKLNEVKSKKELTDELIKQFSRGL